MRIAAAACLVASGLMIGGVGGALAFADPVLQPADNGAKPNDSHDDGDREAPKTGDGEVGGKTGPPKDEQSGRDDEPDEKPVGDKDDGKPAGNSDGTPGDGKPDVEPDEQGDDSPGSSVVVDDGEEPTAEPTPTERPSAVPEPEVRAEEEVRVCENGDDECGAPRPPWWPWPLPWDPNWDPGPGEPPGPGGGSGGGAGPPASRPDIPPGMQVPPHVGVDPLDPGVVSAVPGLGVAAAALPLAPITLPVVVAPPLAIGAGAAGAGAPAAPAPRVSPPQAPRGAAAEPPAGRQPPPAGIGSNTTAPPPSYRAGYTDYLRSAGMSQVVAMAAPGVAGMLALTAAGGLLGYRQAKAGRAVRTGGTARFIN
ncbi:hypothetical protein [Mycobacterium deserti]|uniref:Uncharacterized protein n=1 Tax=Mycobacterium deserti TaxID=2978347 RepID=A0ABT2MGY0_9MYCO|nr:hypothetical protein [Mycobacterium deserti]MCT7661544.1 hypothetical protein [Mycobacterium deserti]